MYTVASVTSVLRLNGAKMIYRGSPTSTMSTSAFFILRDFVYVLVKDLVLFEFTRAAPLVQSFSMIFLLLQKSSLLPKKCLNFVSS